MGETGAAAATGSYRPFGALLVERVTKADGRYLLFYSWPEPSPAGAASGTQRPGRQEAWTPEGGPAEGPAESASGGGPAESAPARGPAEPASEDSGKSGPGV